VYLSNPDCYFYMRFKLCNTKPISFLKKIKNISLKVFLRLLVCIMSE